MDTQTRAIRRRCRCRVSSTKKDCWQVCKFRAWTRYFKLPVGGLLRTYDCDTGPTTVYINGSAKAYIYGGHSHVILQAGDPQAPIPADAVTAKFFIGGWESSLVADSRVQYARFTVTVENTCETLPQGDDQLARYKLYNAAGALLKQDET